jgi:hypothetical protein
MAFSRGSCPAQSARTRHSNAHASRLLFCATVLFVTASGQLDAVPDSAAADDDAGLEDDRDSLLREIHDELVRANERVLAAKRRLELEVKALLN